MKNSSGFYPKELPIRKYFIKNGIHGIFNNIAI
jgi:hypothetical protein